MEANLSMNNLDILAPKSFKTPPEGVNIIRKQTLNNAPKTYKTPPSDVEIISASKPTEISSAARIPIQYGLGAAESALLPYELSVAPLASKEAQLSAYRETLFDDLERLQEQKRMGQFDEQDQQQYENVLAQIKDPSLSEKYIRIANLGVRGLAEAVTGTDLKPQNFLEKAASWSGLIKDPKKIKDLLTSGINPKTVMTNLMPTWKEIGKGLGAATGQEIAQAQNFGPLGTMASEIIGDIVGGKGFQGLAAVGKAIVSPKETMKKILAKSVSKDVLDTQKEIIKDFRQQGIQADIGTITDNNLTKTIQARLAASGLTGKNLDNFKNKLTSDIKDAYKDIAENLGEFRYQTLVQAGDEGKRYLTFLRDSDKAIYDDLYKKFRDKAADIELTPVGLAMTVNKLQKALAPGAIKSPQQKAVLGILGDLKKDIFQKVDGRNVLKPVPVKSLLNVKSALNDVINYEVQGGQKQLLKSLVGEISNLLGTIGTKDKEALRLLNEAENRFAAHAKTFRNDVLNNILVKDDPSILMNQMNSIQGIRMLRNAFAKSQDGQRMFNSIARLKFDEMIGKKMTDNVSEQLKLGTFSNLLKNPKDKQLIKELLGQPAFSRLEKLQKLSGKLSQTASKFLNASQSFTTAIDVAVFGKLFTDIGFLLTGNPWPLFKSGATLGGATYISKLISDPKFLKDVEDLILATQANNIPKMQALAKELQPDIIAAMKASAQTYKNKESAKTQPLSSVVKEFKTFL